MLRESAILVILAFTSPTTASRALAAHVDPCASSSPQLPVQYVSATFDLGSDLSTGLTGSCAAALVAAAEANFTAELGEAGACSSSATLYQQIEGKVSLTVPTENVSHYSTWLEASLRRVGNFQKSRKRST